MKVKTKLLCLGAFVGSLFTFFVGIPVQVPLLKNPSTLTTWWNSGSYYLGMPLKFMLKPFLLIESLGALCGLFIGYIFGEVNQ